MTRSHLGVRMLCEGAIMVALAQILSYLKLMELPNGGSLTPAMFPIILFAVRWGLGPGLMAGFVFGLLQLIFDGAYAWGWQSMLLDYLVAFTPLGLAGLFRGKKWGIFAGTIVGCAGRFLVHYISGVTIYKILVPTAFMQWTFTSPELYSIVYNGSYMLPNTIIAMNGEARLLSDYTALLAFFLMGCVFIAIGMFLSSLTESQIIAAVSTFAVLLVLFLWDDLVSFLPSALSSLLSAFSFTQVFYNFVQYSMFDLSGLVLYLSLTFLFLFLTVQTLQKRRWA